jgi:hypothetical protein
MRATSFRLQCYIRGVIAVLAQGLLRTWCTQGERMKLRIQPRHRSLCTAAALASILIACGESSERSEPPAFAPSPGVLRAAPLETAPVSVLAAGFNDAGFQLLRTLARG